MYIHLQYKFTVSMFVMYIVTIPQKKMKVTNVDIDQTNDHQ